MALSEFIGIRVTLELKARYVRLSRQPEHRGRDEADLQRMALEDWATEQEKKLHLKAITPDEIEQITLQFLAERANRPTAAPRPAPGPVSYTKGSRGAAGSRGIPRKPRGPQN